MGNILYTVAFDKSNNLILAKDAEKGDSFTCPICDEKLILRKSGKTGKGAKRPHFAHHKFTENCKPETVLHYTFKRFLSCYIENQIIKKAPIPIRWKCKYCDKEHTGNLLKTVADVKTEYNMNVCQPDIALFNSAGRLFAVIEIIVTHKPEDKVVAYYKDNNIILIEIILASDDDINNIEQKISNPDLIDFCYNPKCPVCGEFQTKKELVILDAHCRRCGNPMKVTYIILTNTGHLTPPEFNDNDIKIARTNGVILDMRYSKTMKSKYLANICPRCRAFIGEFFLFDDYIIETCYDDNLLKYDAGFYCKHCGN
jgi:hypothetical protein